MVRLTNLAPRVTTCPAHFPIVVWMPHDTLPRDEGYVRVNSSKYRDWQVLVYEHVLDKELLRKEKGLYEEWLSRQPPAVERPIYTLPRAILRRDKATTGTRYPTDENECDREIEDSILRQQAQDGPTERTRSETDSGDSHCADHHQKPITRVKDENGDISKRSNHSAAASTTCNKLGDDSPLLKESINPSDD